MSSIIQVNDVDQFLYYMNYVLRNVVPCRGVGLISSSISLDEWVSKNGYTLVFSFQTKPLCARDQGLERKRADFIFAIDPFERHDAQEIKTVLDVVKRAKLGSMLAIRTQQYHGDKQDPTYMRIDEWISILNQLGITVHVYDGANWSVFLVLKR